MTAPPTIPPPECVVCGETARRFLFERNSHPIVECEGCGLKLVGRRPDKASLENLYSRNYFTGMAGKDGYGYADYEREREQLQINFRERIHFITDRVNGGRLLDVGCAMGFFLEMLGPEWEKEGVDISDYAARYAREKLNLNVRTGSFLDLDFPENSYDAITMWDAIEHFENPAAALLKARQLLKAGGIILIVTGDAGSLFARFCGPRWRLYNPPQHLWFFTRETIHKLLRRHGLEPLATTTTGRTVSRDYLLFVLSTLLKNSPLRRLAPLLRPALAWKKSFHFNLCDLMLVVGVKH